ncbi:MAG: aryl-sulfate sulfotransferase [Bacteroidota bacterium]|nr:aryl-sulfate sulfotransferase [Bacteroidota bacterium]
MKTVFARTLLLLCILGAIDTHAQTFTGYTLYSKMGSNTTYLLDINKNIYHSWTNSVQTGYSCYLLENQVLLRSCQYQGNQLQGAAMCGEVQKLDWNGNVLWQYVYSSSTYCSHHDIHAMPNGDILLISYEVKTPSEVVQAGCSQSITMWPDKIVEIQPSGTSGGTIVWEWHAWDHLVQDHDASKNNYGVVANHPELLNINYNPQQDWMHTNGIDYNATLDQIVISTHNLSEIYVIDHSTTTAQAAGHTGGNSGKGGDILYRWGNPAAYNQGTSSNQVFKIVHDAHWVPAGCPMANDLVGFNNKGINNNSSCVDIITPPYNGYTYTYTSGSYLPATYTWRHTCRQSAQDQSSSQQFPNGNMLICIASTGYIYEIDANQNLLWSYTAGGTVAKAYRYEPCFVTPLTVTASATPNSVCPGTSTQLSATIPSGFTCTYSWTSNPAGFTSASQNPVAYPNVTTTYYVTATSGTCTATDSTTVTVFNLPATPVINESGDTLYSSASTGNQWYLNNVLIPGASNSFYVPAENGNYQVQVTDNNGCISEISAVYDLTGLEINNISSGQNVAIYPNPTTGHLKVSFENEPATDYIITVHDLYGKVITRSINSNELDLSSVSCGLYILTLQSGTELIHKRILISR